MVYRLYCDNTPQVQIHTHIVHEKISMTQNYGTVERHTYARNKSLPQSDLLHGNYLQCRLIGINNVYNKIGSSGHESDRGPNMGRFCLSCARLVYLLRKST